MLYLQNPAVVLTFLAVLSALAPKAFRRPMMLLSVVISACMFFPLEHGVYGAFSLFGLELTSMRIDYLSRLFVIVFHIACFLNAMFGWHQKDRSEIFAGLAYPAAAMGGVLAGDWINLFIWWELAAITSVFLVLSPQTRQNYLAAMRYLTFQIASGVLLLAGAAMVFNETGIIDFGFVGLRDDAGEIKISALLVFLAFGIKAGLPLIHTWIQDSYAKSSLTGAIILSVFTTKLAVYSMARAFPGTTELVWIGAVMTIFPIFYAVIENDLRKVLTYHITNQVGFMMCGIGIGTATSMNGAVGYAFGNIIFETLILMSLGAAYFRTGTTKATELGGLYRTMPWTLAFCVVGALAVSAFPGFIGFVTKGLILDGLAKEHMLIVWLVLLFASAGVLEHASIKIPFFTFFQHDNYYKNTGTRPDEAPLYMLVPMGIAASICIIVGVHPDLLYDLLPHQEQIQKYHPYASYHLVKQFQLLLFAGLAFVVLIKFKWYPAEIPSTNMDVDWFWRIPGAKLLRGIVRLVAWYWHMIWGGILALMRSLGNGLHATHGPQGSLARTWPVGFMAIFTAILLAVLLIVTIFAV